MGSTATTGKRPLVPGSMKTAPAEAKAPEVSGSTSKSTHYVFLALIFATAAALRFSCLTFDSLWLDEAYQTMVDAFGVHLRDLSEISNTPILISLGIPGTVQQVLENFRLVDPLCPPLHAILLNRWMQVFGTGDFAVRSLSVVASLSSLLLLYAGASKLFNRQVALCALFVAAISPYEINYAQEARMYMLVTLFSTASCLSLFLLIKANETEAPDKNSSTLKKTMLMLAYAGSTFALLNSHYTSLYVVAFQGLYGLAYAAYRKSLPMFLWLSGGWALALAFCAPWAPLFLQAAEVRDNFYVSRASSITWPLKGLWRVFYNWLSYLSGVRVSLPAVGIYATSAVLVLLPVAGVVVHKFPAVSNLLSRLSSRWSKSKEGTDGSGLPSLTKTIASENPKPTPQWNAVYFVLLWALVPALVALSLDIIGNRKTIEISRYLIGTAPAVYLLAGIAVSRLREVGGKAKWLLIAHLLFAMTNYAYAHSSFQREPWRELAYQVETRVPTNELLMVSPHYNLVCLNRYLETPRLQVGTGPMLGNEHIYKAVKDRNSVWLITAQEGDSVKVFIPPEFTPTEELDLGHSLKLTHYTKN